MFQIGIATKHPPLPDPNQLSNKGIDFIRQCLTVDPLRRPTAQDLINHIWMLDFRAAMEEYEDEEVESVATQAAIPQPEAPAKVAQQAALEVQEIRQILATSPPVPEVGSSSGSSNPMSRQPSQLMGSL